jgi:hypothetical protein
MAGPSANYWWHQRLFHNLRGLHWEPRGILILALQESIYGLCKNPTSAFGWWSVDKKFLNDTCILREPGLMNSSSTYDLKKHQTQKNT